MSLSQLLQPFPWSRYSQKLISKIDHPRNVGFFTKEDAERREMRFVEGKEGQIKEGNSVTFYWLVDRDDGMIVDAKFQAFGQSALIGAAEVACELLVGKNYDQAKRITTELIDKQVRDRPDVSAFPKETYPHLNLVLCAIENGSDQCTDLPLPTTYVAPPVPHDIGEVLEGGYPGWKELSLKQKIALIEEVLDRDVRPYIALDAGGIVVLNLIQDRELVIAYQGSCTSCYSSIGTTLSYIQHVLKAKIHPDLVVIPDIDPSQFH
jgi:NifU-like protein